MQSEQSKFNHTQKSEEDEARYSPLFLEALRDREERAAIQVDLSIKEAIKIADFWCGEDMLAQDAIIPKERIGELLAGDAGAWNSFDLTLRSIKQIYKKIKHNLYLPSDQHTHTTRPMSSMLRGGGSTSTRAARRSGSIVSSGREEDLSVEEQGLSESELVIYSALKDHRVGVCVQVNLNARVPPPPPQITHTFTHTHIHACAHARTHTHTHMQMHRYTHRHGYT